MQYAERVAAIILDSPLRRVVGRPKTQAPIVTWRYLNSI